MTHVLTMIHRIQQCNDKEEKKWIIYHYRSHYGVKELLLTRYRQGEAIQIQPQSSHPPCSISLLELMRQVRQSSSPYPLLLPLVQARMSTVRHQGLFDLYRSVFEKTLELGLSEEEVLSLIQ